MSIICRPVRFLTEAFLCVGRFQNFFVVKLTKIELLLFYNFFGRKKDKNHTTWRLFRNSSRVFFLGLTREFRLLVKDAINRSRKLHNSVAEPYSDFEVRISAKASLKKGLFKNYVDKRGWVENFVYSEKATKC